MGQNHPPSAAYEALDDDRLLGLVAQQDRRAFHQLMTRRAPAVLALAQRVIGNAEDADEIVQEAFLKVWRLAERWRPDGEAQFSTWLHRVVLNACIDRKRRKPHQPLEDAGDPADERPDGEEQAAARQRRQVLQDALTDVPERQRAALSMYYFADVSAAQAAAALEVTVSAMESLLVRGKRALRAALAKRGVTGLGEL